MANNDINEVPEVNKHREEILIYWFGQGQSNKEIMSEKSSLWWKKDPKIDKDIYNRFNGLLQDLISQKLNTWKSEARGYLAMIILGDQYSRNMYRDTPEAFASDSIALNLSIEGIEAGVDKQLRLIERVFFYMPCMHSESREIQKRSIELFSGLVDEASDEERGTYQGNLNFAIQHQDIIEKFSRFPHRNGILGRESTADEQAFLKTPGPSF